MNRSKILLCAILYLSIASNVSASSEDQAYKEHGNETRVLDVFPGVKLIVKENREVSITMGIMDLLVGDKDESRNVDEKTTKTPLQRIGMMMMMAPMVMQLLSLPGAIATIKISLIRSIFMAKLAMLMMLYNALRSSQTSEVVYVHQTQHHQHYYNEFHQPEDYDQGWFG
ncbi:hypothetical protein KM043_011603 [Ampulex compressa]|nr:hypothetical protein KM043_011603 [Ampulex compressa]